MLNYLIIYTEWYCDINKLYSVDVLAVLVTNNPVGFFLF